MVVWKNIPILALAFFLLIFGGTEPSRAQGTDAKKSDAQAIDFTFRGISLGNTFEAAKAKAEKLKFKFFYVRRTLPDVPDFIKTRDCSSDLSCDNLLIYFNFTESVGHVARIIYSHPVEIPLNTEDVISALEESYGPATMKAEGKTGSGENYLQWGGDNKPDAINLADTEKTPELIGGRYILATIMKNKHSTIDLTLEITDSLEFINGKDEIDRLIKLKTKQEKEAAIKKMKFR